MNKGQLKKALQAHKERERAKKADGLTVKGYPYSHNPYLAHELVEDCYPGCVLMSHVHDFEPDGRCAHAGNMWQWFRICSLSKGRSHDPPREDPRAQAGT